MLTRVLPRLASLLSTALLSTTLLCLSQPFALAQDVKIDRENKDTDAEFQSSFELAVRLQTLFGDLAESVRPAVVSIASTEVVQISSNNQSMFDKLFRGKSREFRQQSLGSGVIIDERGYILTNSHVVKNDDRLLVKLWDKREAKGTLIKREESTDIALVKIDLPDLKALPMGDSDSLRVGYWVLAIGNPFGLNQTVSTGIVSAVGRSEVGILDYESFIQTDASINQGNSGGPLVNLRGEIVGINTAIYSGDTGGSLGIGFSIPVNLAKALVHRWIEGKNTSYLGVVPRDIDEEMVLYFDLDRPRGVFVKLVSPDTPAAKAGLKAKDLILKFGDEEIRNLNHLKIIIARSDENKPIPLEVLREGERIQLDVRLAQKPSPRPRSAPTPKLASQETAKSPLSKAELGITVAPIDKASRDRFEIPDETRGMVIWDVESGGPADKKGIEPGDVITELNYKKVDDKKEFFEIFEHAEKAIMVRIERRGNDLEYFFFKR